MLRFLSFVESRFHVSINIHAPTRTCPSQLNRYMYIYLVLICFFEGEIRGRTGKLHLLAVVSAVTLWGRVPRLLFPSWDWSLAARYDSRVPDI